MAALASLASPTFHSALLLTANPLSLLNSYAQGQEPDWPTSSVLESQFAGHYPCDKVVNPHPVSNGIRLGGWVYTRLSTEQELWAGKRLL